MTTLIAVMAAVGMLTVAGFLLLFVIAVGALIGDLLRRRPSGPSTPPAARVRAEATIRTDYQSWLRFLAGHDDILPRGKDHR